MRSSAGRGSRRDQGRKPLARTRDLVLAGELRDALHLRLAETRNRPSGFSQHMTQDAADRSLAGSTAGAWKPAGPADR